MRPLSISALLITGLAGSGAAFATDQVQTDYMLNCQGCHLPDGRGFPVRNVPDLTNHMGKFLSVEGGREFLVRVPGASTSDLPDDRLAAVLNWMLETFSPNEIPTDFLPYTADEVGALRASPLIHVTEEREKLMMRIEAYEAASQESQESTAR